MRSRSIAPMRAAKIGYVVISALLCVLGVLLIAKPALSVSVLGTVSGVLLIVFGAVRLLGYFSRDLYRLAFQYDLAFGIVLIALGVIMLFSPTGLMTFICITMGLYILSDGLFKIQIALDSKRFGLKEWWVILLLAILAGAFGTALLFRPGEGSQVLMILLGITLLAEGILNFITVITAVKIVRHQQPDVIEVEICEDNRESEE